MGTILVRIIDMLNSSRQMMFENSVEGFEYSARGTGFLCRYLKHDFAITAHHVVRGFVADSIRILFHQAAREFVPYNAQLTIKIPDIEDPDWADLAVFPLEQTLYEDRAFGAELPYVIPDRSAFWQPNMSGHFIMRGFPHDLNAINYDTAGIRQQAILVEADYVRPSPMVHCSEIRFRDVSMCTTLDGLSGTPVFWLGQTLPREHRLAGLVLRASHGSKIGHFVSAEIILAVLDKALAQNDS